MNASLFPIFALLPVMLGPLPQDDGGSLLVELCGGGTLKIDLGQNEDEPAPPCRTKGCHAGECRKGNLVRSSGVRL
ncbi:MAG: hypothetical protein APF82_03270 [Sphingomonadales bacterium BRH_c42]|nr:MAG: hypothetical protein APF82_03270 [Sphingomonadales bacterium BRH_c42]